MILLLRLLGTVLGTALHPAFNPGSIKRPTDDVVTNPRQVLNTAPTDQNNRVFLQVVANPWNVSRNFDQVGQTHTGVLPQCRVRLLWRHRPDTGSTPRFCGDGSLISSFLKLLYT